jgi:prepilin-type N-terminal cleavage/methylation domain-containing protein/prepilin-type processing-associated H-X9-DG protein
MPRDLRHLMFSALPAHRAAVHARLARSFTLVELLVVVAIIAVLASLLLPALAQARGRSQAVTCLNNEKQMVLAAVQYADEEEGWLPFTGRFACDWMIKLAGYFGAVVPNMSTQINHKTSPDKYYKNYRCPTTFNWPRSLYYYGSYGYNLPLTSMTAGGTNTTDPTKTTYVYQYRRKLDAIVAPDRTLLVGDCYIINAGGFGNYSTSANPATELKYSRYHQGYSLNMAFCDGSAANLRAGQRRDLLMGISSVNGAKLTGWTGLE